MDIFETLASACNPDKTIKVTISLTPSQKIKAKKDSIEVFGKENLSGYIQVLIQNGLQNRNSVGKK